MNIQQKKQLLQKFWYNTISYQSLMEGLQTYEHKEIEGYISYIKVGRRSYIVVGDPICSEEDMMQLIHAFRSEILLKKWRILFISISQKVKVIFELMWFWILEIGREALFDIQNFTTLWTEKRNMRNLLRRAEKEDLCIRRIETLRESDKIWIETLNSDWLTTRKTKGFSFLLKLSPFENLDDKILFVAEKDECIVGYISAVPIYGRKWFYFEDIIRSSTAPLGTNQLLLVSAIEFLKEQWYELASLGTSPLGNIDNTTDIQHKKAQTLLRLIYKRANGFYNFKGLYHFKKSMCPSFWDPKFIAFYPPRLRPKVFLAIAKAYNPRGITGIVISRITKLVFPRNKK